MKKTELKDVEIGWVFDASLILYWTRLLFLRLRSSGHVVLLQSYPKEWNLLNTISGMGEKFFIKQLFHGVSFNT